MLFQLIYDLLGSESMKFNVDNEAKFHKNCSLKCLKSRYSINLIGRRIICRQQKEELSAVNKKDDTYRIEKVLRKKNGMALVKWLGYDSRSWIPMKDIKDIQ